MITIEEVKADKAIHTYIEKEDEALIALGFTEHSFTHVGKVSKTAKDILLKLGYPERDAELAEIAGYLHDIGNTVNRVDHAHSGAIMAFTLSLDDFVISYFTSGNGFETLPIRIYGMTKKKVTPEINAISTLLFVTVLILLAVINLREARQERKRIAELGRH